MALKGEEAEKVEDCGSREWLYTIKYAFAFTFSLAACGSTKFFMFSALIMLYIVTSFWVMPFISALGTLWLRSQFASLAD